MMSRGRREIGHIYNRCIEHKRYKVKDFFTNIYFKITHSTHDEMWNSFVVAILKRSQPLALYKVKDQIEPLLREAASPPKSYQK